MKEINLTRGKVAIVDDGDFEKLNQHKWYCMANGYAARTLQPSHKNVYMHRIILGVDNGLEVDHINGNGLDNRRENLRICKHSQNGKNQTIPKNNTSGYKGVVWNRRDSNWTAAIKVDGKRKFLGNFSNPLEAAFAYGEAAVKYFGEFARTNKK